MKRLSCFLFGHSDAPHSILPLLEEAIENEISNGVVFFYVGYHGNFDRLAVIALRAAKERHSEITAILLLAYHPAEQPIATPIGFDGTFYPPIEGVPRRYAIAKANQYMIRNTDSIICYVQHFGNTRELLKYAFQQQKKRAILINNIADHKH